MTARRWNLRHADGHHDSNLTTDDLLDRWPGDPFDIVMVREWGTLRAYSAVDPDLFAAEQRDVEDGI